MCLERTSNIQVAKEDITCYKLIKIYHFPDGDDYRSYFMHAKIKLNEPIKAADHLYTHITDKYLYGQVVHAYCDISCDDDDDWYIEDTKGCPYFREVNVSIAKVECIIPKGTVFCRGIDDDDNACYGANLIIPKKVIQTIITIHRHE